MSLMIVHTKLRSPGTEEKLINVDAREERMDESSPDLLSAGGKAIRLFMLEMLLIYCMRVNI